MGFLFGTLPQPGDILSSTSVNLVLNDLSVFTTFSGAFGINNALIREQGLWSKNFTVDAHFNQSNTVTQVVNCVSAPPATLASLAFLVMNVGGLARTGAIPAGYRWRLTAVIEMRSQVGVNVLGLAGNQTASFRFSSDIGGVPNPITPSLRSFGSLGTAIKNHGTVKIQTWVTDGVARDFFEVQYQVTGGYINVSCVTLIAEAFKIA